MATEPEPERGADSGVSGAEISIDVWSLIADVTPDDDLYFLAATCRRAYAAVVHSARRRLRTPWRACAASLSRLAWASTPETRPDALRWSITEDLYIAASSYGAGDVIGVLELPYGTDPDVHLAALIVAIGGNAPHEIRDPLCVRLWQRFRCSLRWRPEGSDYTETPLTATSYEAAAAAHVAAVAAIDAGGAALSAFFARVYYNEREMYRSTYGGVRPETRISATLQRLPFSTLPGLIAVNERVVPGGLFGFSQPEAYAKLLRVAAKLGRVAEYDAIAPWVVCGDAIHVRSVAKYRGFAIAAETVIEATRIADKKQTNPELIEGIRIAVLSLAAVRGQLRVPQPGTAVDVVPAKHWDPDIHRLLRILAKRLDCPKEALLHVSCSVGSPDVRATLTRALRVAAGHGSEACLVYRGLADSEFAEKLWLSTFDVAVRADKLDLCQTIYAGSGTDFRSGDEARLIATSAATISRASPRIRAWVAAQVARRSSPEDFLPLQSVWGKATAESVRWGVQTFGAKSWFRCRAPVTLFLRQITQGASDAALAELWEALGLKDLNPDDAVCGISAALCVGRLGLCDWLLSLSRSPLTEAAGCDCVSGDSTRPETPGHEAPWATLMTTAFAVNSTGRAWITKTLGAGISANVLSDDGTKLRARFPDVVDCALIRGRPASVDWFRRRYGLTREQLTAGRRPAYYFWWFGHPGIISNAAVRRVERYLDLLEGAALDPVE